jgi:hypothetical protein
MTDALLAELDTQFEATTREVKKLVKIHRKLARFYTENEPVKRKRPQEEEEVSRTPAKVPKPAEEQEEEEDWTCEGRLWESLPCIGGSSSRQKTRIRHDNKLHTVCKGCKLAKSRYNRKKNKEAKVTTTE